jgi:hypothetical protein
MYEPRRQDRETLGLGSGLGLGLGLRLGLGLGLGLGVGLGLGLRLGLGLGLGSCLNITVFFQHADVLVDRQTMRQTRHNSPDVLFPNTHTHSKQAGRQSTSLERQTERQTDVHTQQAHD